MYVEEHVVLCGTKEIPIRHEVAEGKRCETDKRVKAWQMATHVARNNIIDQRKLDERLLAIYP